MGKNCSKRTSIRPFPLWVNRATGQVVWIQYVYAYANYSHDQVDNHDGQLQGVIATDPDDPVRTHWLMVVG